MKRVVVFSVLLWAVLSALSTDHCADPRALPAPSPTPRVSPSR